MSIRYKIILVFSILIIPIIISGIITTNQFKKISEPLKKDIPQHIQDLSNAANLDVLSQTIKYYDEVLTQAARNYAFTKDIKWKDTYTQVVPNLDEAIKEALSLGDATDQASFEKIDASNIALIAMEEESIILVDKDMQQQAIDILESKNYWDQKAIYKNGLTEFIDRRGFEYNTALTDSLQTLEKTTKQTQLLVNNSIGLILGIVVTLSILVVVLGIVSANIITKPMRLLEKVIQGITKEGLGRKVDIKSKDEIGHLAEGFNKMSDTLQQTQASIESKVVERTAELEKINKYLTGRELKMIELKKKLKEAEGLKESGI